MPLDLPRSLHSELQNRSLLAKIYAGSALGTKAVGWIKWYLKAAGDLESKHNTCPGVPFLKVKLQACLKNWNCLCRLHN